MIHNRVVTNKHESFLLAFENLNMKNFWRLMMGRPDQLSSDAGEAFKEDGRPDLFLLDDDFYIWRRSPGDDHDVIYKLERCLVRVDIRGKLNLVDIPGNRRL